MTGSGILGMLESPLEATRSIARNRDWRINAVKISLSEVALAANLKGLGVDFVQQALIGLYMVDFLLQPNIVVECEGIVHSCHRERDYIRTAWLEAQGYRVWRIPNYEVFEDPASVARMLRDAQRNNRDETRLIDSANARSKLPPTDSQRECS